MSFDNPFILPDEQYQRRLNPIGQYRQQCANFIAQATGVSLEEALAFVQRKTSKGQEFALRDKKLTYTEREDGGDREIKEGSYYNYIASSIKAHDIMAPSLTMYTHPTIEKGLHGDFILDRIGKRNAAKKQKFVLMSEGKREAADDQDAVQMAMKISNNSLSGAQASKFNYLFNKTAHSTLTSNCRVTANYGSANNEKLICGNRHYWGYDIVINNIISITSNTDYAALEAVMQKYNLAFPDVEETMDVIYQSTRKYWHDTRVFDSIRWVVAKLTPLQRAAFVYTGDIYQIRVFNPEFMRTFITRLATYVEDTSAYESLEERAKVWKIAPDDILFLAAQIMDLETAGTKLSDLNSTKIKPEQMASRDPKHEYLEKRIVAIMANVMQTMQDYYDFIRIFFTSTNVPASVAYYPESIRDTVMTGDTDSTIFTVQDWKMWYFGDYGGFGREHNAMTATVVFIASQAIVHILAQMSANVNVARENLFKIAMKNEYKFPVYIPTQVAKHYYAFKSVQEGIVFKEPDLEKKGVHLKNSSAPKFINEHAEAMMIAILTDYQTNGNLKAEKYIKWVLETELLIEESLKNAEPVFFRLEQIKPNASYKNPNPYRNNFGKFLFWNQVFGHSVGRIDAPPYMAIRVSLKIRNKTDFQKWLDSSPVIKPYVEQYLEDYYNAIEEEKRSELAKAGKPNQAVKANRNKIIKTISVPLDIAQSKGFPKELVEWIDTRKTIFDMCKTFYILLESLGLYIPNLSDNKRFLYSDIYELDKRGRLKLKDLRQVEPIELDSAERALIEIELGSECTSDDTDPIIEESE